MNPSENGEWAFSWHLWSKALLVQKAQDVSAATISDKLLHSFGVSHTPLLVQRLHILLKFKLAQGPRAQTPSPARILSLPMKALFSAGGC